MSCEERGSPLCHYIHLRFSSSKIYRMIKNMTIFFLLKESIAYFPLVILLSSVISSLAAKKLDKMLGEKVSGNDIKISRLLT